MKIINWLKPGVYVKRWIILGIVGIFMLSFALEELISHGISVSAYTAIYTSVILVGIVIIIIAFKMSMKSIFALISSTGANGTIDMNKLGNLVYEKRQLIKGPKIVVIGGGTGLSTMLRGLKYYTSNITAIVTVADDGGGSGVLRETLGILPPGDIRNCLLALADTEPLMEELLQYRFPEGKLDGQCFGNLFIAAMDGISDSFEEAIKKMSDVLAVTGKVLPVTLADVRLFGELENGVIIEGESKISKREAHKDIRIKRVFLKPADAQPLKEATDALKEADAIVLGPGSLYTSIIPNLLVNDIVKHIEGSRAIKIYVSNIMTQPGETTGYTLQDHVNEIQQYSVKKIIDYAIVNDGKIPHELREKYTQEGAAEVEIDKERIAINGIEIIEGNFVSIYKNLVRHDSKKLASIIMRLIINKKLSKDKKRLVEFYYLSERMKEISR